MSAGQVKSATYPRALQPPVTAPTIPLTATCLPNVDVNKPPVAPKPKNTRVVRFAEEFATASNQAERPLDVRPRRKVQSPFLDADKKLSLSVGGSLVLPKQQNFTQTDAAAPMRLLASISTRIEDSTRCDENEAGVNEDEGFATDEAVAVEVESATDRKIPKREAETDSGEGEACNDGIVRVPLVHDRFVKGDNPGNLLCEDQAASIDNEASWYEAPGYQEGSVEEYDEDSMSEQPQGGVVRRQSSSATPPARMKRNSEVMADVNKDGEAEKENRSMYRRSGGNDFASRRRSAIRSKKRPAFSTTVDEEEPPQQHQQQQEEPVDDGPAEVASNGGMGSAGGSGGRDPIYGNIDVQHFNPTCLRDLSSEWGLERCNSLDSLHDSDSDESYFDDSSFDEFSSTEDEDDAAEKRKIEMEEEDKVEEMVKHDATLRKRDWRVKSRISRRIHRSKLEPVDKAHQVADELYTSEVAYVDRLHLLVKIFLAEIRKSNLFTEADITKMFANSESIYTLHSEELLPKLRQRLAEWETQRRIGDIMVKFVPFLKLYVDYVLKAETARAHVTKQRESAPAFAKLLQSIEPDFPCQDMAKVADELSREFIDHIHHGQTKERPEAARLCLQHHMLEPIQRIPRYKLLLEQYIKHLPEDSADLDDSRKALKIVSDVASQHNETMKMGDKVKELWEISNQLDGTINLFDRPRDFITQGRLWKVSARHGNNLERERQLFLFSDMLLVCAQVPFLWNEIKARLDISDMEILEPEGLRTAHGFVVKTTKKVIEFRCESDTDEIIWRTRLTETIDKLERRKKLRKQRSEDKVVGEEAPIWVQDQAVTQCMQCSENFTLLTRKHHCRACGIVVCWRCSTKQAPLVYDNNKQNRVCDKCFLDIRYDRTQLESKLSSEKSRGSADDTCLLSSYASWSINRKRTFEKFWLALHKDHVLYIFKAHKDVAPINSIPIKGCEVRSEKNKDVTHPLLLSITNKRQQVFHVKYNEEEWLDKWLPMLEMAARGALTPSEVTPMTPRDRRASLF